MVLVSTALLPDYNVMKDFKHRPSDHTPIHCGSVLSVTSNRDAEDIPMENRAWTQAYNTSPLAMPGRKVHVQGQHGVETPDPQQKAQTERNTCASVYG